MSAGLQSPVDVFVPVIGCQHDDATVGIFLTDFGNCLHAAHSRHSQVHERNIRPVLSKLLDRLLSICRLSHYLHTGFGSYHAGKTLANYWMIVDDHYSNCAPVFHMTSARRHLNSDFSARAWFAPDVEMSSYLADSLAHAEQAKAPASGCELALDVESSTVIPYL